MVLSTIYCLSGSLWRGTWENPVFPFTRGIWTVSDRFIPAVVQGFEAWKAAFYRQFENYVGLAAGYMAESCEQRGVCGIQNVVEADGSVYPCDFYMMDEYRLGNFNTDRLDDINQRRSEIQFIEQSWKLDEECRLCKYFRLCRGGCQRNRDFQPDTGLYKNYFCEGYRMFFGQCYEQIMEIGKSLSKS